MSQQTIGDRIRLWRRRRGGMSQKVLADLSGFTQAYISQIERGHRPLDRKQAQAAIANALNISVAQLLGLPSDNPDPTLDRARRYLPSIRSALIELSVGERRRPRRTLEQLQQDVVRATDLGCSADHAELATMLPDLIVDLGGRGMSQARELVDALFSASWLLKSMGAVDLARQATELAIRVAKESEHQELVGLAWSAWANSVCPENAELSLRATARAAEDLQSSTTRAARQMYGMLHLELALAAAVARRTDDAYTHLHEAARVADSTGEPERYGVASAGFGGTWFGPTNVRLWQVAIAAELGEPGATLELAREVDLAAIPVPFRHVYYWTDVARGLAGTGRDREAMHALSKAERAAPQHFRFSPITRDLVTSLITRAKRRAVAEDLASMAHKLGLDPL